MPGFIEKQKYNDWVWGGLGANTSFVVNSGGQWLDYLPVMENQNSCGWETYLCTSFSTLNCMEIIHKFLTGNEINWSDRFNGVLSGTVPYGGNSLQAVADNIIKNGLVLESECPLIPNQAEFYQISNETKKKGLEWLDKYALNYWTVRPERETYQLDIMKALEYSPLAVGVAYADGDGILDPKASQNHLVALVGYKKGSYWIVMDSFSRKTKKYHWDYKFGGIYLYKLTIKETDMLIVKENEIYHLVEGPEQRLAIGIDGSLFIGDKGQEFMVVLQASGRKNVKLGEIKPIQVNLADWESVNHYNLKGERI